MVELKLGNVESQFADIIWNHEPIPSGELVKICEKELEWKKSTTYTMLKRLCAEIDEIRQMIDSFEEE